MDSKHLLHLLQALKQIELTEDSEADVKIALLAPKVLVSM